MSLASFATTNLSVGRCFHFLMYGASARHVVRIRALHNLIYDLVPLFTWNRTSCEHGIFVGKEVLNTDPHGIYVTFFAQGVRTILFVSSRSKADGGYTFFETAQVGTTLFAFHGPCHGLSLKVIINPKAMNTTVNIPRIGTIKSLGELYFILEYSGLCNLE